MKRRNKEKYYFNDYFKCWRTIFMSNRFAENQTIVIFTAKLARNLLKDGFTIVDIKPDRTDREGKRSVFIFKNETNIEEHIKMYEKK